VEDVEQGYVSQIGRLDGDVHAAAVRRHDDGDLAAISGFEPAQSGLHAFVPQRSCSVSAV
jgi:hypothetical protein